jgi:hypothetical protein
MLAMRALASGRMPTEDERWEAAREAFVLQRAAQPRASGYDVALQLGGGPALFRTGDGTQWPSSWEPLPEAAAESLEQVTTVMVGGRGAATAPVMHDVLAWTSDAANAAALEGANERLIEAYLRCLTSPSVSAAARRGLVSAVARHRAVLTAAPHFPHEIAGALQEVEGVDVTWSFKTTGAGGEDALLLVGDTAAARERLAALGWHALRGEGGGSPFVCRGAAVTLAPFGRAPLDVASAAQTLPAARQEGHV